MPQNGGVEIVIHSEDYNGVEVHVLKSYGVGLDVHSCFIAVCVHVRNNNRIFKYTADFDTDWNSLITAKQWVLRQFASIQTRFPICVSHFTMF